MSITVPFNEFPSKLIDSRYKTIDVSQRWQTDYNESK